ncbi:hypothetical protein F2Q69_00015750 [Brassica cretica]|uniref:Uncharacterized protein n=1 Tax=Brassica cretica TaxID=69181 RepID=A0A8S9R2K0_BRACR|nr:hypothetical protein F2Q69_00015750 [Brassica cretica]
MGRSQEKGQGPIYNMRLSSVGATRATETGTTHEPTGLDLAMKLHYLKAAYIYTPEMARDLSVTHVKEAIFKLFDQIAWTTGRLWRRDSGRPYIKCNDCGARFVEGKCNFTVEEWLSKPDRSVDEFLVYHQPVGPELPFSPLIYVQGPIYNMRLSSVGATRATETGTTHEPTGLDLAMKLHYLKAAYIYTPEMARDLSVTHVKEAIFKLFDQIAWTTGRLWRRDSGRPYIKCNDCGARFVEGKCNFTVEEWLSKPDRSVDEFLVYHQPVGPELPFSPLIYVQGLRVRISIWILTDNYKIWRRLPIF